MYGPKPAKILPASRTSLAMSTEPKKRAERERRTAAATAKTASRAEADAGASGGELGGGIAERKRPSRRHCRKKKALEFPRGPFILSRRRPTFPRSCPRSIIG